MVRRKRFKPPKFTTVIGEKTSITGDIVFEGGMHIDGTVVGNLVSEAGDERATLTLSERGAVEGDVRVANVIINGVIKGNVYAESRVELAEHARISGKVHYRLLEMSMGAEVNGEMICVEHEEEGTRAVPAETSGEMPGAESGKNLD